MQPSELFRRGIVAPRSDGAAEQLAAWDVESSVDVAYIPLPEPLFNEVWQAGLFAAINQGCSTLIDDYEEEAIGPEHLPCVVTVLQKALKSTTSDEVHAFIRDLLELCGRAQAQGMPVYFIL